MYRIKTKIVYILIVWQQYFDQLLSRNLVVSSEVQHLVYQTETQDDMADLPTFQAVDKQKNGKAAGLD